MARRGWFRDPFMHGLAARGIKTSKVRQRPKKDGVFDWKHKKQFLARKEALLGGIGDMMPDSMFDPLQLEKGEKVEREHTTSPVVAREIARDHLAEDPKYYDKLERMEQGACDK